MVSVMQAWGFTYKTNSIWHKIRKDGGSDGRGVGFYFRNVTELVPVWRAREERPNPPARPQTSQLPRHPKEGALAKT
jgi:N6-adenosine-specific RNA methylase IME4